MNPIAWLRRRFGRKPVGGRLSDDGTIVGPIFGLERLRDPSLSLKRPEGLTERDFVDFLEQAPWRDKKGEGR